MYLKISLCEGSALIVQVYTGVLYINKVKILNVKFTILKLQLI